LSSVNSTLEDLVRQQQQPKSVQHNFKTWFN
jgi:hypothetical protein